MGISYTDLKKRYRKSLENLHMMTNCTQKRYKMINRHMSMLLVLFNDLFYDTND